jgi:ankyrin repeat protein
MAHKTLCVLLLLNHGADVNRASNNGVTPLFIASQNVHDSVCALLEVEQQRGA